MEADRIAVYGNSGSGKSTCVKALLKKAAFERIIVFDPKAEYVGEGFDPVYSFEELGDYARKRHLKDWRAAFVPTSDNPIQELHHLANCVMFWQAPWDQKPVGPRFLLVVEEMQEAYPNHQMPSGMGGMSQVIMRGRSRWISTLGVTPRPAAVSTTFRGQLTETYCFYLPRKADRLAAAEMMGDGVEAQIASLAPHEYVHAKAGGVTRGKNRLK